MSEDNGKPKSDTLTINLVRDPWQLTIGGEVENLNVAMAMLQEAFRTVETEWRLAAAIAAQEKHNEAKQNNRKIQSIIDRSMIRQ